MQHVSLGRLLLSIVVLGGCDRVFSIEEIAIARDSGPDVAIYDRCAPIPHDPLRYTVVRNPHSTPDGAWSWADARVECMRRGMDLVVMNDQTELATAEIEDRPYWVGAAWDGMAWSGIDGCSSVSPADGPGGLQCGFVSAAPIEASGPVVDGTSCDGKLSETDVVQAALCETPSPPIGACGSQDPVEITYVLSDAAMSYAEARAHCTQLAGHLAVIDSYAELRHLAKLAAAESYPSFWIGATFDNRTWVSDTTCPGLYSWTGGAPAFDVSTSCVATTMEPDPEGGEDGATGGMHLAGMTPTRCNEPTRALCELPTAPSLD